MKKLHLFLSALALMAFVACGDDENDYQIGEKKSTPNPVDTDPSQASGPEIAKYSLEFPALKGGNSIVLVHEATLNDKSGKSGVNFSIEWDTDKNTQHWTCYKMYDTTIAQNVQRYDKTHDVDGSLSYDTGQYPNDPLLAKDYQFTSDSYKGSGYDHGHICPSQDRVCSVDANRQTFIMTNMQPQTKAFNGSANSNKDYSPWYRLEERVRTWSTQVDTMYVCKGGIVDSNSKTLGSGKNKIPVPSYFFVALLSKKGDEYHAIGFWMKHESSYSSKQPLSAYAKSIDDLEKLTGYNFFCNLADNVENAVEKTYSANDWAGKLV